MNANELYESSKMTKEELEERNKKAFDELIRMVQELEKAHKATKGSTLRFNT